jgi:hypothetical protein
MTRVRRGRVGRCQWVKVWVGGIVGQLLGVRVCERARGCVTQCECELPLSLYLVRVLNFVLPLSLSLSLCVTLFLPPPPLRTHTLTHLLASLS